MNAFLKSPVCLLIVALAFGLGKQDATAADSEPDASAFQVKLKGSRKEQDHVTVVRGDDSIVIDIQSRGGIGRVKISPDRQGWSQPIVLRLHLAGLEGLTVRVASTSLKIETRANKAAQGEGLVELQKKNERFATIDAKSDLYPKIVWEAYPDADVDASSRIKGVFEITLPTPLATDATNEPLLIQWIDFYR